MAKLTEAAQNPRNHRYSSSRGIPKLRQAVAALYQRRFGVNLDPDLEVINTIGAKEGFSHLMWVLLDRGDAALVPSPSYPIHIWGPLFAGADVREVPLGTDVDFFENMAEAYEYSWPKPRVIVLSFPHNPTTTCVDLDFMQKVVDFAREREVVLVHDFAYAELGFDGYQPPSILQVEGAKDVAVELYSMTKSFSMAGWRSAFLVGNQRGRAGPGQAQVLPRLRHLPAHPDRRHGHPQRGPRAPQGGQRDLPVPPRRALRRPRPHRLGDGAAQGHHVRLGADPRALPRDGLDRVRLQAGQGGPGGGVARRRLRPGRRRLRALRPHRERAAHRPGHPPAAGRPARTGASAQAAGQPAQAEGDGARRPRRRWLPSARG